MAVYYFEILRGLPVPLAEGALMMFFSKDGNGGIVGFSAAASRRNIVMIDNQQVAAHFRAFMEERGVSFVLLNSVPSGVQMLPFPVPSREQIRALILRIFG